MMLLELKLMSFDIEDWGPQDYAVSLNQSGSVYIGAIENLTEGRFVPIFGRNTYMTHSRAAAFDWLLNATKARA